MESKSSKLENLWEEGNYYCSNKEFKRAVDCYNQVLQIDPKDTDALNNKGLSYNDLKEY